MKIYTTVNYQGEEDEPAKKEEQERQEENHEYSITDTKGREFQGGGVQKYKMLLIDTNSQTIRVSRELRHHPVPHYFPNYGIRIQVIH